MPTSVVARARVLQARAFDLAVKVTIICRRLPRSPEAWTIRSQLVRAVTSVVANYRAACRAQSPKAFVAKLSIALEEADEVLLWLRLLVRLRLLPSIEVRPMAAEALELVKIFCAARNTTRRRLLARGRSREIVNR